MDTLARTKKLEALGFDRPRAEGLVQMVKQSIDEEVAKKADLTELGFELNLEMTQLKNDIKSDFEKIDKNLSKLDSKLDKQLTALDSKIDKNLIALDSKIDTNFIVLDSKIDKKSLKLLIWIGSLMFTLMSLFFAGLVLIEPIRRILKIAG